MKKKQTKEGWVDIKDDAMMVSLGLRQPLLAPRNESVWTKTAQEKKYAKRLSKGNVGHFHSVPHKSIPVKSKLIVYLKKNSKFPKSTESMICWQSDIDSILAFYTHVNKKGYSENLVTKYSFNGKTYEPNERPFWF